MFFAKVFETPPPSRSDPKETLIDYCEKERSWISVSGKRTLPISYRFSNRINFPESIGVKNR